MSGIFGCRENGDGLVGCFFGAKMVMFCWGKIDGLDI